MWVSPLLLRTIPLATVSRRPSVASKSTHKEVGASSAGPGELSGLAYDDTGTWGTSVGADTTFMVPAHGVLMVRACPRAPATTARRVTAAAKRENMAGSGGKKGKGVNTTEEGIWKKERVLTENMDVAVYNSHATPDHPALASFLSLGRSIPPPSHV